MTTARKRHSRINVPGDWLEAVDAWRKERGLSLGDLGRLAAEALGSAEPFRDSTMSRFMRGRTSLQLAEAVSRATEIPLPTATTLPIPDETMSLWLELGERLERLSPRMFQEELADVRELVEILERKRRRRS